MVSAGGGRHRKGSSPGSIGCAAGEGSQFFKDLLFCPLSLQGGFWTFGDCTRRVIGLHRRGSGGWRQTVRVKVR